MNVKESLRRFGKQIRTLQGEPHYIALGMAIGVFAALTPTVPFQTVIAVTLALVFKASKPAAVIGSLTANPFTIPLFYMGGYKIGTFLLGGSIPDGIQYESVRELLALGAGVTMAILTGGVLLGLMAGCITYLITLKFSQALGARLKTSKPEENQEIVGTGSDPKTLPDKRLSS